jgi:DNA-binding protein HU-beta
MKTLHVLASSSLSLFLVLLLYIPTVTTAASFVVGAQLKGQKANTCSNIPVARTNVRAPILQLQAVAKTGASAAGGGGASKKKKSTAAKTTGTAAAATGKTTAAAVVVETVRKGDFIDRLTAVMAAESDEGERVSKKQAEAALSAVLRVIQEDVALGKKIMLPGFGSFVAKDRAARKGRNPQTGQEIDIPASRSPGFTPSKAWKDALNGK